MEILRFEVIAALVLLFWIFGGNRGDFGWLGRRTGIEDQVRES